MKAFRVLALALTLGITLMAATCVDTATGTSVTKNQDGTTTVTQNPANPVAIAGGVVGSLPLPFAGLIGAAIAGFPGIWAAIRGKAWKNAAVATAQAAGQIIQQLPATAQPAALKIVDVVHDAHDVTDALQTALQGHVAASASAAPKT